MKSRRDLLGKLIFVSMMSLNALNSITASAANWGWDQMDRDFIIGGVTVPASDVIGTTTVAILSQGANGGTSLCTGSLIDTDLVITAGHCVGPSPSKMRIVFRRDLSKTMGRISRVTGYIRHPDYGTAANDTDNNDIALIRFSGGLPRGYDTATLLEDESELTDGTAVILAGYGITTANRSKEGGSGLLRRTETRISQAHYGRSEVSVDQTGGHGACHGDSGGPAFVADSDGNLLLFGVTSRGPDNAPDNCATIGIYTNILAHMDFVHSAISNLRLGQTD